MIIREVKGQSGSCTKVRLSLLLWRAFMARSKDILSRVKARHREYAFGTVHGTLLRELK